MLVDRKGAVEYVVVGDRGRIELPDFRRIRTDLRRFRGLRCIHTHFGEAGLSREDLTDLSLLRLDTMTALDVTDDGRPGQVHTAHLSPDFDPPGGAARPELWRLLPPCDVHRLDLNYEAFIRDLEGEFVRKTSQLRRQEHAERAILLGVTTGPVDTERERMDELDELAYSADVQVIDRFVQRRASLDPRYLLGRGKLQELITRSMQLGATLLIFNQTLTPTQSRLIGRETDLKVIDRSQLILDIFSRRARSQEGKIQVELAQLQYLMPRLVEFDDSLSRLSGGIGGRGPGETSLEVNRRRIKDRIDLLAQKLAAIRTSRRQRRLGRQRRGAPVVSIIGYTNAGKSTLMNAMTRAAVPVEDKLFATLDPVSRRMRLPWGQEVIVSDTVGFIRELPPPLLEAFKATLEEIEDSALIIHLVDATSAQRDHHILTVERLLADLGLDGLPRLRVLNKADRLDPAEQAHLAQRYGDLTVSALRGDGLERLADEIRTALDAAAVSARSR